MPRSFYSGSAAARSALFLLALCDIALVQDIVIVTLIGDAGFSTLWFLLQLPHLLTIVTALIAVAYNRRARLVLSVLFGAFLLAFLCDLIAIIIHVVCALNAETSLEVRRQTIYALLLFGLLVVDALGAHFVDRLRSSFADETTTLATMKPVTDV